MPHKNDLLFTSNKREYNVDVPPGMRDNYYFSLLISNLNGSTTTEVLKSVFGNAPSPTTPFSDVTILSATLHPLFLWRTTPTVAIHLSSAFFLTTSNSEQSTPLRSHLNLPAPSDEDHCSFAIFLKSFPDLTTLFSSR
ncbi:hypothetical protein KSP39_PZI009661 [Platanthera zijinensis]|uniref:Uncharacterized protein n=1 Tax=Platanthera zijinensis TaxID=2320716 RepID=A0AAP0G7I1_9ASPA